MSLWTIYGINGVGKDTIANRIQENRGDVDITSESRLSMYHLGIIDDYSTAYPATRDDYKRLENTPQSTMLALGENEYRDSIESFAKRERLTILLSHLVFALYLDKEVEYLDTKPIPDWFIEANTGFVQLKSDTETIFERKIRDGKIRDRGDLSLQEIDYHQGLCDNRWSDLRQRAGAKVCEIVYNEDLSETTGQVERIINMETA